MLVPVALDGRGREGARAYACGLVSQGVRELLVAKRGLAPVLRRRCSCARPSALAATRELVEPYRDRGSPVPGVESCSASLTAPAHQADIDVICCGTEGKSFVDYPLGGSPSGRTLVTTGDERTMTHPLRTAQGAEDPGALAR